MKIQWIPVPEKPQHIIMKQMDTDPDTIRAKRLIVLDIRKRQLSGVQLSDLEDTIHKIERVARSYWINTNFDCLWEDYGEDEIFQILYQRFDESAFWAAVWIHLIWCTIPHRKMEDPL